MQQPVLYCLPSRYVIVIQMLSKTAAYVRRYKYFLRILFTSSFGTSQNSDQGSWSCWPCAMDLCSCWVLIYSMRAQYHRTNLFSTLKLVYILLFSKKIAEQLYLKLQYSFCPWQFPLRMLREGTPENRTSMPAICKIMRLGGK